MTASESFTRLCARLAIPALLLFAPVLMAAEVPGKPAAGPHRGTLVELKSQRPMKGYLVKPEGKGPFPGIVVVQEWWGLNNQIKGVADRLAAEGYAAIVPDLYHGKIATDPEQAHVLMRGLDDKEALADLGAAVDYLKSLPEVGSSKIGSVGFCMGGGLSLQLDLNRPDMAGAVMFYGQPESDPARVKKAAGPVLGLFGEQDEGIPKEKVMAMEKALKDAGKGVEVKIYPGAGHAFFNETRPSYNAAAAADAWSRTLAFFKTNLKG